MKAFTESQKKEMLEAKDVYEEHMARKDDL